jgi:hypothetical protein
MTKLFLAMIASVLLVGCGTTRSISYHTGNMNYQYGGELSQMDVIASLSTDGAVDAAPSVALVAASRVILIQSGQQSPAVQMVSGLAEHLDIVPFSGVPSRTGNNGVSWRQAATAGGVHSVLVYWGSIETSYENRATKAISWVPLVGWGIPDEHQRMRVAISYVVSDVATGIWTTGSVASDATEVSTSLFSRQSDDERQIETLKQDAYDKLVTAIRGMIK